MEKCCKCKKTVRSEEDKKAITSRLNRISGQINGIKKMIEEDKYCDDVLIQLSAVNKSIKSLANLLIEKHMNTCVVREITNGNTEVLTEIVDLFKRFQ